MGPRLVVDAIVRPEYIVRYEQHGEQTFIHTMVSKWTPRVAKQFRADIDTAHSLLGRPVYALQRPEAPNQTKFLTAHGFVLWGSAIDAEGREVAIYERSIPSGQPIWRGFSDNHPEQ